MRNSLENTSAVKRFISRTGAATLIAATLLGSMSAVALAETVAGTIASTRVVTTAGTSVTTTRTMKVDATDSATEWELSINTTIDNLPQLKGYRYVVDNSAGTVVGAGQGTFVAFTGNDQKVKIARATDDVYLHIVYVEQDDAVSDTLHMLLPKPAATATPTATATETATAAPTATATLAPTATATLAPTASPTATATPAPTATPTATATVAPTATPLPDINGLFSILADYKVEEAKYSINMSVKEIATGNAAKVTDIKEYRVLIDANAQTAVTATTGTVYAYNAAVQAFSFDRTDAMQYAHIAIVDQNGRVSSTLHFAIPAKSTPVTAAKAQVKQWIYAINGVVVDATGDSKVVQQVKHGDKITYRVQVLNNGTVGFKPTGFRVTYPTGLKLIAADNTGWTTDGVALVSSYSGAVLNQNESATSDIILTVDTTSLTGLSVIPDLKPVGYVNAANENISATISVTSINNIFATLNWTCPPQIGVNAQVRMWVYAINGTVVSSSYVPSAQAPALKAGDVIWYKLEVLNAGTVAFKPTGFTATLDANSELDALNANNVGWTNVNGAYTAAYTGGILNANNSATRDLVVRVKSTFAAGDKVSQNAGVAGYSDVNGAALVNSNVNNVTVVIGAQSVITNATGAPVVSSVNLATKVTVQSVNGVAYTTGDVIRAGDTVVYQISVTNAGTVAAKPTTITLSPLEGLLYPAAGMDCWTLIGTNQLKYTVTDAAIAPGATMTKTATFTVGKNNDYVHLSASLQDIVDANGTRANNADAANGVGSCRINVTEKNYGSLAQTGDSATSLVLPIAGGLMLMLGAAGTLFVRKKKRT